MQLKLQRSQRAGGLTASTIFFCLDVRADYAPEERANISRYKLGSQTIYNSRAAQKHLEMAGAHLDRTQEGTAGNRFIGLVRGAASLALAKMQLNVTIASLGRGHHIECKDMEELLESEDTIRGACKNLTRYLDVANTFDGSEVVVEYVNGEERVHVAQNAPPLLEFSGSSASGGLISAPGNASESTGPPFDLEALWRGARRSWAQLGRLGRGRYVIVGGVVIVMFLLLRSCVV